jgi:flagellar hook assembly protein FlgD
MAWRLRCLLGGERVMIDPSASPTTLPPTNSTASGAAAASATSAALQNANFMQIMLAEITTQDPTQPEDTSQMVQEMESMQQLANTQAQAYQNNLKFAQQLVGEQVNVQQQQLSASDLANEQSQGLNPSTGDGTNSGTVTSYKDINQSVYVTVGGYDYPIANVTQVMPASNSPSTLAAAAQSMLGNTVGYTIPATTTTPASGASGQVTGVSFDSNGNVQLTVGNTLVPYSAITSISSANNQ